MNYKKDIRQIGISSGDTVLLHSSIINLDWKSGGGVESLVQNIYDDFLDVIGDKGTLIVPTFSFDFTDNSPSGYWSLDSSESDMGVLTEYVRQKDESERTVHPFYSFCIVGNNSEEIGRIHSVDTFSREYIFGYLHENDYKIMILGTDYNNAMTFFHYVEQDNGIDINYRYKKKFRGIMSIRGKEIKASYYMMVRNLDMGVKTNVNPMGSKLEEKGTIETGQVGGGIARVGKAKKIYDETTRLMKKNDKLLYEIE